MILKSVAGMCLVAAIILWIYLGIYRLSNPDMTSMRAFINTWPQALTSFVLFGIFKGILTYLEDK